MFEKRMEAMEIKKPSARNVGIILILLVLFIVLWGTFVIIPAGHRGVVLW